MIIQPPKTTLIVPTSHARTSISPNAKHGQKGLKTKQNQNKMGKHLCVQRSRRKSKTKPRHFRPAQPSQSAMWSRFKTHICQSETHHLVKRVKQRLLSSSGRLDHLIDNQLACLLRASWLTFPRPSSSARLRPPPSNCQRLCSLSPRSAVRSRLPWSCQRFGRCRRDLRRDRSGHGLSGVVLVSPRYAVRSRSPQDFGVVLAVFEICGEFEATVRFIGEVLSATVGVVRVEATTVMFHAQWEHAD